MHRTWSGFAYGHQHHLLAKAAAGTVTLNSDAKVNGDCDQDGTISQADAAILMQFLVHLVDELPVQGA